MDENEIAAHIVDSALQIHRTLGPGLLENIYKNALAHELRKRDLDVRTEAAIPIMYHGIKLGEGFADHHPNQPFAPLNRKTQPKNLCVFAA